MKNMILGSASALALLAGFGLANAADIPVKAPPVAPAAVYNWSGFYIGGVGGYNNGDLHWLFDQVGTVPAENPQEISGWNGGGFVGAQWQAGRFVIGAEAQGLWGDIRGWATCPNPFYRCQSNVDELWTVGGRLGWVWGATGQWLSYVSGGWASARVGTEAQNIATGVNLNTGSARHDGAYLGTGMEFVLIGNWIFGTEYRHYWLEERNHAAIPGPAADSRNIKPEWDSWTFRLSYKFGWGARP